MTVPMWGAGEPLSARKLNGLRAEALRSRGTQVTGPGSCAVGSDMPTVAVHHVHPSIQLCVATEDFKVQDVITDLYGVYDQVQSGKAVLMRMNPATGNYQQEQGVAPFRVYHPLSTLQGAGAIAKGDVFYACVNRDSQRREVIAATGTEMQCISFAVISTDPANRSAIVEIRQRTFRGEVYNSILNDTVVDVYDTDGCFLNEPNVDLTGRLGKAMLFYTNEEAIRAHFDNDATYAPPRYWNVFNLCCPHNECEI